jgi:hypothetical protein
MEVQSCLDDGQIQMMQGADMYAYVCMKDTCMYAADEGFLKREKWNVLAWRTGLSFPGLQASSKGSSRVSRSDPSIQGSSFC